MWTFAFNGIAGFFITYGLLFAAALAWIFVFVFFARKREFPREKIMWILVSIMAGAYIFYALILSALQYYTWKANPESQYFLPPHTPISYFLDYAWLHFWYTGAIAVIISFLVGGVFWFMNRDYSERFMKPNEIPLIILGGLIVGWPSFVIYLAGALLLGMLGWIYSRVIMGASRVNLAIPFFLSAGIAFLFGGYLIAFLHLNALIVVGS